MCPEQYLPGLCQANVKETKSMFPKQRHRTKTLLVPEILGLTPVFVYILGTGSVYFAIVEYGTGRKLRSTRPGQKTS